MKKIYIGIFILGLILCFSKQANAQTDTNPEVISSEEDSVTSLPNDNDTWVNVAYKKINKRDISNSVSVINTSEFIDKNYNTYAFEGIEALVGGANLWNIGDRLVLVDGVPRSIYELTTNEIEQITYLKGINAIALYGSRAANGVILITTKRGKAGERSSNVYVNTGINTPKSYPEYLGSAEFMTYYNQARLNDGLTELYAEETIENYSGVSNSYQYPNVDYYSQDYLRKFYNSYSANADFTGGNDKARFYALAGFSKSNSLLNFGEGENEGISRLNIRGSIDLNLNDYIKSYVTMSNVFYDSRVANGDYWEQATVIHPHRFAPLIPVDLVEGGEKMQSLLGSYRKFNGNYLLGGNRQYLTNPIADAYAAGYNTYTSRQFQYTNGLDIDLRPLLEGLSFHGQVSIDYSNNYRQSIDNEYAVYIPVWDTTEDGTSFIDTLEVENRDRRPGTQNLGGTYNNQLVDFNLHLDYVKSFQGIHNISAMLLAAGFRQRVTGEYQSRTFSNLGIQFNYNYDHRYYFDFSGAVVNSTKLSEVNRVAFSPTFSLGWLLSEEGFLSGSSAFDHLKLTASAGVVNTDLDIDNYFLANESYASTAWYSWGDGTYTSRATTAARGENLALTYAKRKEANIGIDGAILSNKINFKTSLFLIKKDGIPVQSYTQYPVYFRTYWPETSFVPYTNFEENLYKGLDFQLNYNAKLGDLELVVGVAGTYVTTEALVRDELYEDDYRNRAGKPVDAVWGLENDGFFIDQNDIDNHAEQRFGEVKPGDIKYIDQNGDGIIDERDEVMIGRGAWGSPFTGGIHFTAKYKNLTMFVLGTGQFGGSRVFDNEYYWVYGDRKYSAVVRDSWTEETKNTATYPRLTTLSGDNNFRSSDFWLKSTDQINLSKIQLTYTVPDRVFSGKVFEGLNIYLSATDLIKIAKNKEILELNIGQTPQTRFYNLGVKAMF
ncbi:MAG: SusC/RagA family TonB-linked outer membrane protein [Bacteroidales bacterium]|nr:SusC/RagA family TonB-linked outer membrane protein [Bacteroidales bacterium]MBN2820762.1 SusC/RagA family TonB-linked outer membrane protein [Bacteroidales bacterium]